MEQRIPITENFLFLEIFKEKLNGHLNKRNALHLGLMCCLRKTSYNSEVHSRGDNFVLWDSHLILGYEQPYS